jgi:hypothetical protein
MNSAGCRKGLDRFRPLWRHDRLLGRSSGGFAGIAQCSAEIPEIAVELSLNAAGASDTCLTTGGDVANFASYVQARTLTECRITHVKGAQAVFEGTVEGEFVGGGPDVALFDNSRTVTVG